MLDYPLTVISAPAGSGKTTLLAEWIALLSLGAENIAEAFTAGPVRLMNTAGENRVCWLSLDEGDNYPVRFLTYLTAVLRTVKPDLGEAALMMLAAPEPPSAEAVLVPLVNELSETREALFLVLDDYHVIKTQAVHASMTFLLDHLPPCLHIILATRADPPLPLARLRGRMQLIELRDADLRFTEQEAGAFLT